MREKTDVVLTPAETYGTWQNERQAVAVAPTMPVSLGCLLLLADGASYTRIQQTVGCTAPFVSKWKCRFLKERLAGLYARHQGRPVQVLTPRMQARILSWTKKKPTDGSTHWSTRRLAKKLGIHHMMVARTWKKHGFQPHRIERYKASDDPDFETKAADIIGLYMNPPQHAAVFCMDEKTAIQALDRRDPILPLSPGRAERHGFEYVRPRNAFSLRRLQYEDGSR